MNPPDETPKLSPLPFIIADIVLLITTFLIVTESADPLAPTPLISAVICVCLGAILACIPVVINYTRRREEILHQRQRQFALIAQSTTSAAAQLSGAVDALDATSENTAKMLKHAEQLPPRLQEKIAEFKEQLNEIAVTENESLQEEVNTLRASETERLETALTAISKTSQEISATEKATQAHIAELRDTLAKHTSNTTASARDLSAQNAALTTSRAQSEHAIANAQNAAQAALATAIEKHTADAIERINARFATLNRELDTAIARHTQHLREAATTPMPRESQIIAPARAPETSPAPQEAPAEPPQPKPAKTSRRAQTHTSTAPNETSEAKTTAQESPSPATPPKAVAAESAPENEAPPVTPAPLASAPASISDSIATITDSGHANHDKPQADVTITPPATPAADANPPEQTNTSSANAQPAPVTAEPAAPQQDASEAPPPTPRKRAPKPRAQHHNEEPMLGLDLPTLSDEFSQTSPDEDGGFHSAVSTDGLTRLLVTAYIGIGNKLYIRGDGAGLNWDKGTPLQFVSIGKWRWENGETSAPISFKLYKNDTIECTRIGSPKLEPGHQHEVTANF